MKSVESTRVFLSFLLAILLCSAPASATSISFNMTVIFEGIGEPTNPAPWVVATFDDGGSAGTVDLTISAPGLAGNPEKVAGVYFNLDPAFEQSDLDAMVFSTPTITGECENPVISLSIDTFQANGDGVYDILIAFDTDGPELAFNGGDIIEYTIELPSLTANSFLFPSYPDGGTGNYVTAAHLMSLGGTLDSAWITVPEPTTILLLGLGGLLLRRKRKV